MPDTVAQIFADCNAQLPDLNQTRFLRLLDKVNREIYAHLPEITMTASQTVALVAGTQEYALDEYTFQTMQAWYANEGGTAFLKLGETSIEFLEKQDPLWRSRNGGAGTAWLTGATGSIDYYISTNVIASVETLVLGFNYPPDATTALGSLTLYQSRYLAAPLNMGGSVLPNLVSGQIYVEGVLRYAARELRPEMAGAFEQTWQYQLALNKFFIRTRNEGLKKPQFINVRADGTEWPQNAANLAPTPNGSNSAGA